MAEVVKEEVAVGRPPKPAHLRRTNRIVILLTDDEVEALDQYVEENDFADRNDFGRSVLMDSIGYERRKPTSQ